MIINDLNKIIDDSIAFVEGQYYKSFDILDSLTNPFINKITKDSELIRRIAIQINARLPVSIRMIGMKSMMHTKTLSDFLSIYSLQYSRTQDDIYLKKAQNILEELLLIKIKTYSGIGWGLNFPYTTRFVNAGISTPNLYNTVNSLNAILDYYNLIHDSKIKNQIRTIISFVINDLGITNIDDDLAWISYFPNQKHATFNVNAMAAASFVRTNYVLDEELVKKETIIRLTKFIVKHQNSNGSWYYALSDNGKWIDGFHTGFILESLATIQSFYSNVPGLYSSLLSGYNYFISNLFTDDFWPSYYPKTKYPIESQNCAQAIQTIANISSVLKMNNREKLKKIIENVISVLYNKKGYFYYKKSKNLTYKQIYFRWSQSPMVLSLIHATKFLNSCE